jgi:hypothetical protein
VVGRVVEEGREVRNRDRLEDEQLEFTVSRACRCLDDDVWRPSLNREAPG